MRGKHSNYAVNEIGMRLLAVLREHYSKAYPSPFGPELELMLGGYDAQGRTPCIVRINVREGKCDPPSYNLTAHFGAQRSEIGRLVFSTDTANIIRIENRHTALLDKYRASLQSYLSANQINIQLPGVSEVPEDFSVFSEGWQLNRLEARFGEFSIQNAIDCVDFLINIMIRSHQFKSQLPSVVGPVQIGVIRKGRGFKYVSERVWRHGDTVTPIDDMQPRLKLEDSSDLQTRARPT